MAKKHSFDYDLIVIGSGAGGSAAATIAAREGKKVAIVEEDTFGGDSPNYSDVPTKALLHAAQLLDFTLGEGPRQFFGTHGVRSTNKKPRQWSQGLWSAALGCRRSLVCRGWMRENTVQPGRWTVVKRERTREQT